MKVFFDIETHGKNPLEDKITLIGMSRQGQVEQFCEWELMSEHKMLQACLDVLATFDHREVTVVGFNLLKFDLPYLLFRAQKNGILNSTGWDVLMNRVSWFDLRQYRGKKWGNLETACGEIGFVSSHPELKGIHMPVLYDSGEFAKIKLHNQDDLRCTEALYESINRERPIDFP